MVKNVYKQLLKINVKTVKCFSSCDIEQSLILV